jgi:hypothetical protein
MIIKTASIPTISPLTPPGRLPIEWTRPSVFGGLDDVRGDVRLTAAGAVLGKVAPSRGFPPVFTGVEAIAAEFGVELGSDGGGVSPGIVFDSIS